MRAKLHGFPSHQSSQPPKFRPTRYKLRPHGSQRRAEDPVCMGRSRPSRTSERIRTKPRREIVGAGLKPAPLSCDRFLIRLVLPGLESCEKPGLQAAQKDLRGEAREKAASGGVHRKYVDARRLSATKPMSLFQQPARLLDPQFLIDLTLEGEVEHARDWHWLRQAEDLRIQRQILFDLVLGGNTRAGKCRL